MMSSWTNSARPEISLTQDSSQDKLITRLCVCPRKKSVHLDLLYVSNSPTTTPTTGECQAAAWAIRVDYLVWRDGSDMTAVNAQTCKYCFMDFDIDNHRKKLATGAAFVHSTNSRYGFSSKDLRDLGGSELSRIKDLISTDHEWASRNNDCGGIEIRPQLPNGRMVVELFWDVAPLACENFATLCSSSSGSDTNTNKTTIIGESGKLLMYKNSVIHRVIPGFVMQGGDFVFGNGSGGESIFGKKFKDERAGLMRKHNCKGLLSMGNSGKNSNTSQFFFTFQATPQCDGKHVIFGRVISGFEVLDYIETFGTSQGEPSVPIIITDCGIFNPLETPGAGYWFDQPNNEAYSGVSPVFTVQPRVAVVAPSPSTVARFQTQMGNHAVVTAVCDEQQGRVQSRIDELLSTFAVDVVVVAPACSNLVKSVPESHGAFSPEEVVLEAKPVDALKAIWTRSWLHKRRAFPLDGATS